MMKKKTLDGYATTKPTTKVTASGKKASIGQAAQKITVTRTSGMTVPSSRTKETGVPMKKKEQITLLPRKKKITTTMAKKTTVR